MTELQAEQAAAVPWIEVASQRARYRDVLIALIAFAVLASLPLFFGSKALLDFVIRCSAFGLFATSLNLLVGYTGMISFGHGMFFGLGAYGFGLIMQRTGVPVPVAFVATLVITAVVATVIGAICVRLKEIYFAFVTLAFQMLIHSTILSWASLTGGDQGLRGGIKRPVFLGIDLSNHVHLYVMSCALLVIGLLLMRQIAQSPFGYTLRMIRDNANRASFIGIDVWRAKLTIFVLAALFASTGGIIMALFVSGAYPEFAYWTISGEGIFINMLGGVTTFLGPMVGTVLLLLLNDTVTRLTEYYGIVLGIVILFFAIGLRKGLMDFVVEWVAQRRGEPGGAQVMTSTQRISVVTGGASGIGEACVREFARAGDLVVVVDRDLAKAEAVAASVKGKAYVADVGDELGVDACAGVIERECGPVDVLVNCAGILQVPERPHALSMRIWDDVVRVDQRGTYVACLAFARAMLTRRRGSIVNIASIAGMRSMPLHAYGPAKAAVIAITECLAAEWGPSGIRINAVSPGYTLTPALKVAIDKGERDTKALTANAALRRLVAPEEIARVVGFLASDAASAMTGANVPVDCGWLAGTSWSTYGGLREAGN